jgi:hypothetical protein
LDFGKSSSRGKKNTHSLLSPPPSSFPLDPLNTDGGETNENKKKERKRWRDGERRGKEREK